MSFGATDVASNPPNSALQMGTNGTISYGSNLSGSGNGTAGSVQMAGTTGQGYDLRCSASATLAKSGGDTIPLSPVKVSVGTPQGYGSATSCNGTTTTVLSGTLSATGSDNIVYLGGQLDIGATSVNGSFSTTNVGGSPITLSVIFL